MNHGNSVITLRLRRLPRRHRIAHLRALLRHALHDPRRRAELTSLLRNELAARLREGGAS